MAQYKVIQDIEAEDKLLGPLTLRQFIYAAITIAIGYLCFRLATTKVWFIDILLLPPFIFFGLLAAPFGHEQSSEVWMLGKFRYWLFPKKRLWDQEGIEHLVTVTAPPKIEKHYSDGLSKTEVKSRLKTLSATLDTRGWVVKGVANNAYVSNSFVQNDERLLQIEKLPSDDQASIKPAEDMLDSSMRNPVAENLFNMVDQSEEQRRRELLSNMQSLSEKQKRADELKTGANSQKELQPQSASQINQPAPSATISPSVSKNNTQTASPKITAVHTSAGPTKQPMTQQQDTGIINTVNKRKLEPEVDVHNDTGSSNGDDSEVVVSLH